MESQINADEAVEIAREFAAKRGWNLVEPLTIEGRKSGRGAFEIVSSPPEPGLFGARIVVSEDGKICLCLRPQTKFSKKWKPVLDGVVAVGLCLGLALIPISILGLLIYAFVWLLS